MPLDQLNCIQHNAKKLSKGSATATTQNQVCELPLSKHIMYESKKTQLCCSEILPQAIYFERTCEILFYEIFSSQLHTNRKFSAG